jgi:outer membrane protein OmpA-like peptidoglycan-associated protein
MHRTRPTVVASAFAVVFSISAAAQDVAGSSDHPVVARYKGATIRHQSRQDFDSFTVPLGPADKSEKRFKKEEQLEGKVTKTLYEAPAGASPLAVSRSYQDALKSSGFEILYSCAPKQCNEEGRAAVTLGYSGTYLSQLGGRSPEDANTYLLTARHPTKNLYVNVVAFDIYVTPPRVFYTVNVVEVKPMQTEMVVVKAEELSSDIARVGHASIYGIYFDTGKSVIKSESKQALAEIARLLTSQPTLKLHVVGHTDNVGALASNMTLAKQRAEAVVSALVNDHRIAAARLIANGVGPLAPVASNAAEEGRAKNRRVELVAQ